MSTFSSCIDSMSKPTLTFLEDVRGVVLNATLNNILYHDGQFIGGGQ